MEQFKFIPHGRKLLLKITGKMSLTGSSSIIQAETVQAPFFATVIEAGEGEWQNGTFVPTQFKKGDNVLILDGQSGEVFSHGESLLLVYEDAVIGSY